MPENLHSIVLQSITYKYQSGETEIKLYVNKCGKMLTVGESRQEVGKYWFYYSFNFPMK